MAEETFEEQVDRVLRDHEGYTGDGQGGVGALPVGDRSTAAKPIDKCDLRTLMKAPVSYALRAEQAAAEAEAGTAGINARLDDAEADIATIQAGQSSDRIIATSWIDLRDNFTGGFNGQGAEVPASDAGTHDNLTATGYDGLSVTNAGLYRWDEADAGWLWVDVNAITAKADRAAVAWLFEVAPVGLALAGGTVRERGETVTPELSWTQERNAPAAEVVAQTVDDGSGAVAVGLSDESWSGSAVTGNTTFSVAITDGVGRVKRSATAMRFHPLVFWGSADAAVLDAAGILALADRDLAASLAFHETITPAPGQYVHLAWPAAWGDPSTVTANGLPLSGYALATVGGVETRAAGAAPPPAGTDDIGNVEAYRVLSLTDPQNGPVILEVIL